MRRLFTVLAKFFGVVLLYWALITFTQISFALINLITTQPGELMLTGFIGAATYFVLTLGGAWICLARTRWLADLLKIHNEGEPIVLKETSLLSAGIKLFGIYVTFTAIPEMVRAVIESITYEKPILDVVSPAVIITFGLLLLFKSDTVLGWITKKKSKPPVAEAVDTGNGSMPEADGAADHEEKVRRCVELVVISGTADWVSSSELARMAAETGAAGRDEVKAVAVDAVKIVLQHKWMKIGDSAPLKGVGCETGTQFREWGLSDEESLARVEREWNGDASEPFWLFNTDRGDDFANTLRKKKR